MNYAIIAAGEGSRLKEEGFSGSKPMVRVGGEYLIQRLLRIFRSHGAEQVCLIINRHSPDLSAYLSTACPDLKVTLIEEDTPSSLHSFACILRRCHFTECCLTTVDTVFSEDAFSGYIRSFQQHPEWDALMACTRYVDDEKPLYIQADAHNRITAFMDSHQGQAPYVSAGIYCLRGRALEVALQAVDSGVSRMRNYQRALIEQGLDVYAYELGKVIDIDHVSDVPKAEALLQQASLSAMAARGGKVLAIQRAPQHSPGSEEKDRAILQAVQQQLAVAGYEVQCVTEAEFHTLPQQEVEAAVGIVSMARSRNTLQRLSSLAAQHRVVLNSPRSIHHCCRAQQVALLRAAGIGMPATCVVSTHEAPTSWGEVDPTQPLWVKRGDFQTELPEDVSRMAEGGEVPALLARYHSRGIAQAVLMQHVEGDVVKFYGVGAADSSSHWFHHYYPTQDKFHTPQNCGTQRHALPLSLLQQTARRAAQALGLEVYGGDAVVDAHGHIYIIDMNDFPSFGVCRAEAAEHIAHLFCQQVAQNKTQPHTF